MNGSAPGKVGKVVVRRAVPEDLQRLLAFYRVFHPHRHRLLQEDLWRWKYQEQVVDSPGIPFFVLEVDGEIQGGIGYISRKVELAGSFFVAAFPVDYFIAPECRGLPAARLLRAVLADCDVAISAYVSPDARRVLTAAGFSDVSERVMSYHFATGNWGDGWKSTLYGVIRTVGIKCLSLMLTPWTWRVSIQVSSEMDEVHMSRAGQAEGVWLLHRSPAWMKWRFASSPELECQFVYLTGPKDLAAVAVVAINPETRVAALLSVSINRRSIVVLFKLVEAVVGLARRSGCHTVTTQAVYPELQAALRLCMFGVIPGDLGLLVKTRQADLQKALVSAPNWNFVLGDSDAV